jgi:hypothetical protein
MHDPCHAHDWNVCERGIVELMLTKRPPIHEGHADVQEHETRALLSHQSESFRAIFRSFGFVAV